MPPAPGPDIVISVIVGASTMTALNGPSDRRQRVAAVEKAGKDADADAAVAKLGDAEQLQREAELLRVGEVVGLDLADALVGDVVEVDRRVESQPGEDRHLRRGVGAADVVGRIGLGVAELLRSREHLGVRGTGARHLGEDEVGGAVDDPEDLGDLGRRQALLDHADHRDDAGDRGLEAKLDTAGAGRLEQLVAVLGDQLLVRGDDVLARLERPQRRTRERGRFRRSARRRCPSSRGSARSRPRIGAGPRRPRGLPAAVAQSHRRCSPTSSAKAPPTVPRPSTPDARDSRRSDIARKQVVVGLAANDEPGFAVLAEDRPADGGTPL